jgi:DNA-directed RNA polymerase specialized sigma24 family protein
MEGMMTKRLEEILMLVRDGHVSFAEFVIGTRTQFRSMAGYLARKWTPPSWMTLEDLEQELYLAAWHAIWDFEEGRGVGISKYVVFNAISGAKRALHKARGAKLSGSPDRNPSRMETPLAQFIDGEQLMINTLAEPAEQESLIVAFEDRKEAVQRAVKACKSDCERAAVLAIVDTESIEGGARVIYDDVDTRLSLRLGSEEAAERFVYRTALAVAERVVNSV